MEATPHPRQAERLTALYSYDILDTAPEKEFDDVVRLAASLCGSEIALINLIDVDRQWVKAEVGLDEYESPLQTSICSHAILEQDYLEIPDTLQDYRVLDNPVCLGDGGFRFFAGALLKSDGGLPIGTLCVLDRTPRTLTPLQQETLRVLAEQVMNQLNLQRAVRLAAVLRQEVDHRVKNSFQIVASLLRLQASIAPSADVKAALDVVRGRIATLAALHEQLYSTDDGDRIDLASYVKKIAGYIARSGPDNVEVTAVCDTILVSSQHAASIGIVLNEFATNSFKHAFPENRAGLISFTVRNGDMIHLICKDDGVGMDGTVEKVTSGLGMKIIEAVTTQVGGILNFDKCSEGVQLSAFFPVATDRVTRRA